MTDADHIRDLLYTYAERLDAGDLDGVAALFARATFSSSGRDEPVRGIEQIRRVYDPVLLYDAVPRTKHVIASVVIDHDGVSPTASSRCSFTVFQAAPGLALQPILAGRYHDSFRRFDDGWWFTERLIHPDLPGQMQSHWAPYR